MKKDLLVCADADTMLGKMCETGAGTEKYPGKATFYCTRAANEGHPEAKARLNALPGKGVPETGQSQAKPSLQKARQLKKTYF